MFRDLQIVTLDFETYFSAEYSLKLKKYNTSGYIRDPQFKAQCVAIKMGDDPVVWIAGERVPVALKFVNWSKSALLCHNTAFDGYILAYHYGIIPAYYLDTLSMARAIHSNSIGASLSAVSRYYGVGNKLPDILNSTKGVRDLPPNTLTKLGTYCAVDTELCRKIFDIMRVNFPEREFDLIDLTLRMFCEPKVILDLPLVLEALDEEVTSRQKKMDAAGVDITTLRSDQQLAEALTQAGLPAEEVPRKWSVKQEKEVWAFAKGDLEFTALREHPNQAVRALVDGRLAAKTSYGESRALRFLEAGKDGKPWPILLNYCGAHTTRWTGGDRMNPQNLKRGGKLRKAVMAPPGYVIIACDSSQIEARVVSWLADHHKMLHAFKTWDDGTGPDVYKLMASKIYGKPLETITKEERFVGKVVVLGAGYGMGADKYEYTLAAGLMGPPMVVPNNECRQIIGLYRSDNPEYPKLWQLMDHCLFYMTNKKKHSYKVLEMTDDFRILLPNGLYLNYPGLEGDYNPNTEVISNYRYYTLEEQEKRQRLKGDERDEIKGSKIYGGLLTENVTQALARLIVADQMLTISKELPVVTMTHDEVVCIVKEAEAEQAAQFMLTEMRKPPSWCMDLPLNAEVEYGVRYG
jgi:DNA polymerase